MKAKKILTLLLVGLTLIPGKLYFEAQQATQSPFEINVLEILPKEFHQYISDAEAYNALIENLPAEERKSLLALANESPSDFTAVLVDMMQKKEKTKSLDPYDQIETTCPVSGEQVQALQILRRNPTPQSACQNFFLQKSAVADFELLRGRHDPNFSLLSRINRTETTFGYLELAKKLISPSDDIEALQRNQAIIRQLAEDESLFNHVERIVKGLKKAEANVLSFWSGFANPLESVSLSNVVQPMLFPVTFPLSAILPDSTMKSYDDTFQAANKAPLLSGCGSYLYGTMQAYTIWAGICYSSNVIQTMFNIGQRTYNGEGFFNVIKDKFKKFGRNLTKNINTNEDSFFSKLGSWSFWSESGNVARKLFSTFLGPIATYYMATSAFQNLKWLYGATIEAQEKLIHINEFINETLEENLEALQPLRKLMPELTELDKITHNTGTQIELKKFLNLLQKSTFQGSPSAFFSSKGNIQAAYSLLETAKNNLIPMLHQLGKLDAYLSLAKLYKEFAATNTPYCFVEYGTNNLPVMAIEDFWNPFLDPEKAVPNSILPREGRIGQNIIISGPNAGGKSTAMKGLGISVIMAQTCGIVPARHFVMTPFSYIDAHLNITDDIATNKSLYMAEATRVKEILENLTNLEPNEFSLIVVDELFNSTNPESGSSIGRAIGRHIAYKIPNCICIIASHLSDITNLENDTEGIFKNYKVHVNRITDNSDTSFSYPYTLSPGKADQSIAIEILENLDFDQKITEESKELYLEKKNRLKTIFETIP